MDVSSSRDDYIKAQLDKKYGESFEQFKDSQNDIIKNFDLVNEQINQLRKKAKNILHDDDVIEKNLDKILEVLK